MIKIHTLYFEGKYTPEYIERLYNGLKRHSKVDFEFVCYSDTDVVCDKLIPLPKDTDIQQHWHKMSFFDKEFTGEGEIIVMDIDQVVVSDITDMLAYPVEDGELVSYHKWWSKNPNALPINGGWYKFKAGTLDVVWNTYATDPIHHQEKYWKNGTVHYKYFGEQNFVYDTCIENGHKVTQMPGQWVAKYDQEPDLNRSYNVMYMQNFDEDFMILGDEVNPNIKIVHFANFDNTIHDTKDEWVKEYWF